MVGPPFTSWEATKPHISGPQVNIPCLGSCVSPGTFIVVRDASNPLQTLIGRIVRIADQEEEIGGEVPSLVLNLFVPLSQMQWHHSLAQLPFRRERMIPELVQTKQKMVVRANSFCSLAFVFTLEQIRQGSFSYDGMTHWYLVRFRYNKDPISEGLLPFPACYSTQHMLSSCYASRIYEGLSELKALVRKGLTRYGERQGEYPRTRKAAALQREVWDYVVFRTTLLGVHHPYTRDGKKTIHDTSFFEGLKRSSTRVPNNKELLRFETEEDLRIIRNLLGQTTTLGVRKRHPRAGTLDFPTHANSNFNVVTGVEERVEPFVRSTTNDGIDFEYAKNPLHPGGGTVTVVVRATGYGVQESESTLVLECPSRHLRLALQHKPHKANYPSGSEEEEEEEEDELLLPGTVFEMQGVMYTLATLEGNTAHVMDESNNSHTFEYARVRDAISAYLQ